MQTPRAFTIDRNALTTVRAPKYSAEQEHAVEAVLREMRRFRALCADAPNGGATLVASLEAAATRVYCRNQHVL